MAPFVHCSTARPGRFTDGSYGMYYAGDREDVALAETIHHHAKFMAATDEAPGWTSDFRAMIGSIDRELHDVNAVPDVLQGELLAKWMVGARLPEYGLAFSLARYSGEWASSAVDVEDGLL